MNFKTIRARAPLRLGLAGGGTDISPYCDTYGGAVLNATIDRYAYATIEKNNSNLVQFCAQDFNLEEECKLEEFNSYNFKLILHKEIYKFAIEKLNDSKFIPVKLSTFCDAPAGSGLGSSSTLVVAMLKAFFEYFDKSINNYDLAKIAYDIERIKCNMAGGRQDQYSATFGGLNFMEFNANFKSLITPLRINQSILCELEASIILYFTGKSRDSSKIINDQSNNVQNKLKSSLNSMHAMKKEAFNMRDAILLNDLKSFVDSIKNGWLNKKKSSAAVSNKFIESIYDTAISNGALAGKVSGAGGGGFMWFYVHSSNRIKLVNSLLPLGGVVSNCHFVQTGAQSWRVD